MDATLIERSALRFTPAGVPVIDAQLQHRSRLEEGGVARDLDFAFDAIAIGAAARMLAAESLGSALAATGFLAPRSRRSKRLLVHVLEFTRGGAPAAAGMQSNESAGRE